MIRRDTPSGIKYFAGYILLPDAITFPQYYAWQDALSSTEQADGVHRKQQALIPGFLAIVSEWHLANFPTPLTFDNFPAAPDKQRLRLISWLLNVVTGFMAAEDDIPNG